jgi:hypothetical protein
MTYNCSPGDVVDPTLDPPPKERVASAITTIADVHSTEAKAGRRRHRWLTVMLWIILGTGPLVPILGPRLEIANNTFVIPQSLISERKDIQPAKLVADERTNQLLSAIFTIGGALGLGLYYRNILVSSLLSTSQSRLRGPVSIPLKSNSRIQQTTTKKKAIK